MAASKFTEGTVIYSKGEPLEHISLIAEGEVEGSFGGHTFLFGKTDVLGLCDLLSDVHTHTYNAISDGTLYQYPCTGIDSLDTLMRENADIAYVMVGSMCRQIAELLQYKERLKQDANGVFDMINDLNSEYSRLCKMYASTPKKLPGLDEIVPFSGVDPVEDWLYSYYIEINDLNPATHKKFFHGNPGVGAGFLRKCVDDVSKVLQACHVYHEYLDGISSILLNENGFDLFSLISDLHMNSLRISGADETVDALMSTLTNALSEMTGVDSDFYQSRMDAYWDALEDKRASQGDAETTDATTVSQGVSPELLDSLKTILEYSGCDDELAEKFTTSVNTYTELPDRASTEDDVPELRRELTKMFYVLYKLVFLKTLEDSSPPTVVKMFLIFGYVDPALAGFENASYLYSIADSYKGDPENSIYTGSEWLTSIYNGERDPSLSEFDMDWPTYLRDLKNQKQIDAKEEATLLVDRDEKLKYEMENAFPVVNRVTFGNPSKFCPIYADHNLLREPEITIVTPAKIKAIIDEIRELDFSVFYRETGFTDQKLGITSETISVEIIPNIVLMPNAGLRGSMWQEIEGRLRTTPARMFLPIFLEGDLKTVVTRLIAEFRWELCRRIQGSRWNDLSDPSLTSYFCDYLQFYMNNRSLAMQTMNEIRNELSAARNSYKTVFVNNYVMWLHNESKGMARLNSVALGILMTFCPFNAEVRETLTKNMRYNEALTRFGAKRQKRLQRLTLLIKKLQQGGKVAPQELLDELEFAKR